MTRLTKNTQTHSSYTVLDLARAVELLRMLDDPATLPDQRAAAKLWFRNIFLKYPVELRRQALRTARALRHQKGS